MTEAALRDDLAGGVDEARDVVFRSPIDSGKPDLFAHIPISFQPNRPPWCSKPAPVLAARGIIAAALTPYWVSTTVAAPGHASLPGARSAGGSRLLLSGWPHLVGQPTRPSGLAANRCTGGSFSRSENEGTVRFLMMRNQSCEPRGGGGTRCDHEQH